MTVKKNNPITTMLVITTGFLLVHIATHQKWALTVAFIAGVIGIASKPLSKQVDFLWMKLTHVLSLIMPRVLLSVVFYLFLFPVSLIARLFGKGNPSFRRAGARTTTFETVNRSYTKESFDNPW